MPFRPVEVTQKVETQEKSTFRPVDLAGGGPDVKGLERTISERDTIFGQLSKSFRKEGVVPQVLANLELAGAPFKMIESAIANPALVMQQRLDPREPAVTPKGSPLGEFTDIVKEASVSSLNGLTGKRLGEIGDVFREAGVPAPIANTAGLGISILIPSAIIGKANKAIKGVRLGTDKGIIKAGKLLSEGADEAVSALNANLDKAYSGINKVPVDDVRFIDEVAKLPKELVSRLESRFGKLELLKPTIENVRKIKGALGKIRSSAFGKSADLKTTFDIEDINSAYGGMKKLIQESLIKKDLGRAAKQLLKADDAFTEAIRSSNSIKRLITDPDLLLPTKAGKAARGLITKGDTTQRVAIETLKKSGGQAKKHINKAVNLLNNYNNIIATTNALTSVGKTALFAGLVGSIGAKVARKVLSGGEEQEVQP